MSEEEPGIEIPIVFIGAEDAPIAFANQFVVQHHNDEFLLTVGQITPPIVLGSDEEKVEQLKRLAYVPVKVVGRYSLTRQRLVELIEILRENLASYDRSVGGKS